MSKRTIKKVAVIGSGIMGSGIACHFANIGLEVLLLDYVRNRSLQVIVHCNTATLIRFNTYIF